MNLIVRGAGEHARDVDGQLTTADGPSLRLVSLDDAIVRDASGDDSGGGGGVAMHVLHRRRITAPSGAFKRGRTARSEHFTFGVLPNYTLTAKIDLGPDPII